MAIAKMKLIRVYGMMRNIDDFLLSCCISGDFHPETATSYLSHDLGFVPMETDNPYLSTIAKIEELANVSSVKLKDSFMGSEIIVDPEETVYVEQLMESMNKMHDARAKLKEENDSCQEAIAQFNHFSDLDASISELLACKYLKVRFGSIPKDCLPKLEAFSDKSDMVFIKCGEDSKNYWGVYAAPKNKIDEIDRIFSTIYFERTRVPFEDGTPTEIIEKLSLQSNELAEKLKEIDDKISDFWSQHSERCERTYAHYKIISRAFDLRRYGAKDKKTGNYYTFVGWVPETSLKWFEGKLDNISDVSYEVFNPEEDTRIQPPVKLRNKKWARPFEFFVEMYGLPSYGDIDVTPFVAFTYTLLFGIMFADLGQGFVLGLFGLITYKLKGWKLSKVMVPCGLSSMIFGFLFGDVFGYDHLLDPVFKALGYHGANGKPIVVMDSITSVLLISIAIGVTLVIVSMLLNVFLCLRKKQFAAAFFSESGVTGILLYIAGVSGAYAYMAGNSNMTVKQILPWNVIIIIAVITLPILFFKELIIDKIDNKGSGKPESWGEFFATNFFEVIEYILSYFSNTISYLRIGAFVLVHVGMMSVFTSFFDESEQYSFKAIIIMILGNCIIICLEGLLSGIQVLRLEYYEMFSRFYQGDGKPFKGIGRRKNRSLLFKIKSAFASENEMDDSDVIINTNH